MADAGDRLSNLPPLSRLCHLQTTPSFKGYGFELHRRKNEKGHFIGPIDAGSPSEMAGLHTGDEIIEIQGTNVQNISHGEVVQLLLDNSERVTLLVTNSQLPVKMRNQGKHHFQPVLEERITHAGHNTPNPE